MDSQRIIELLLLIFVFILIYTFALYPIILWILSKLFNKPFKIDTYYKPEITIIIAAHNEENYIRDAILSIYNSDYPIDLINVIVGSDGSTDKTVDILHELQHSYPNISFFEYPRSGKNFILNQIVPKAQTDIILFMDADLRIVSGTLLKMLSLFTDDNIGAVMASLTIVGNEDNVGRYGETLYQKLETFIRTWESKINSNINSLGTLYGIKKELYNPIPNDLVCDDLYRILYVSSKRKRVIFYPVAEVLEVRNKSLKGEIHRRIRLVSGGLSTIWKLKRILLPNYGSIAFFVISHKLIRYFSPFILIGIFICTFFLSNESKYYYPLVYSHIIFYLSASLGLIFEKFQIRFIPFRVALLFISMNVGFLLGVIHFLIGGQNAKWERI